MTKWHRSNFEHKVPHHNGISWFFKGGTFGEHWHFEFAVNQPSSGCQTLDTFECFLVTLTLIVSKNVVKPTWIVEKKLNKFYVNFTKKKKHKLFFL